MSQQFVDRTRTFLTRYVTKPIGADEDMFASGLLNSLFAMQLLLFIEQEFDIVVGNEDLDLQNFSTLSAIARFVERKQASGSGVE